MKKKILASILIIGILALALGWGTHSYFSDIETSRDNYFVAGTMDLELSVGAGYQNPWSGAVVTLEDMKPCEWAYEDVWLHNVGDNPGSLWMHIFNVRGEDFINTDAESEAGGIGVYDIYNWITFDLSIVEPTAKVIINPKDDIKLSDINCVWIPLGDLNPSSVIKIQLSFHLQEETDNKYQGDRCLFDVEFFLNQVGAPPPKSNRILLENKDTSWNPIIGDGKWGIVEYETSTLTLKVWAHGLTPNAYHQICLNSQPAPSTDSKKVKIASALASGQYTDPAGTAPPSGSDLYRRGYWTVGPNLVANYANNAEGIFNVEMFAKSDGTGYLYASQSATLPSGEYDAVKLIIKEAINASPPSNYGTSWPPRLMECWVPLYFTIS